MTMTTHFARIVLTLGLLASVNAFADDFNTVLNPAQKDSGDAKQSRLSVTMPKLDGGCGWSINDYVRNCSRATDARSEDAAVKS